MSDTKNTLFTIGQFADLHGINKKTLMWYDQVGLFKPYVVKDNGYRYYTYYQSSTLETILMLRDLNVSVDEIRRFMKNKSAGNLKLLLEEKVKAVDENMAYLKSVRKVMVRRQNELSDLLAADLSDISVVEREKRYLAMVRTGKEASLETEIEMVIGEAKKHKLGKLRDASYGSMISVENLHQGKFEAYDALFVEIPNPADRKRCHIRQEGKYLRAYCKGSWDNIPSKYEEMLQYARQHSIRLGGYAYETGINETVINTMEEYITQIEIMIWE